MLEMLQLVTPLLTAQLTDGRGWPFRDKFHNRPPNMGLFSEYRIALVVYTKFLFGSGFFMLALSAFSVCA
jgi:hypothetical protein